MIQANLIPHGHADLVTRELILQYLGRMQKEYTLNMADVAYDFYGERLATCSADQRIKIFRRSGEGNWALETEWKAHDAPILRLSFAHPLHGSLLASCSHDRSVRIWEEPSAGSSTSVLPGGAGAGAGAGVSSGNGAVPGAGKDGRWLERGVLSGAKGSVRGVEFGVVDSPMGLRVASIATDSTLRIYTSLDPSLSDWSLSHEIHVPSLLSPGAYSAEEADAQSILSSQYPGQGQSAARDGASAGASGYADTQAGAGSGAGANAGSGGLNQTNAQVQEAAMGGWGLSWCKERWWGGVVGVIAGTSPAVKIISLDPLPTLLLSLAPPSTSNASPLTTISWAPSCGRAYHHIATGARDGTVRIWKVTPGESDDDDGDDAMYGNVNGSGDGAGNGNDNGGRRGWKGVQVAEFTKGARVGMVEWNATGTVLTVSDDDGVVRMYKATYDKSWKLAGKISAEEASSE